MPRKPSPALTDAEARVMTALWRMGTATVGDVVGVLRKTRQQVSYSTVQTILRILENKAYVSHEKVGRAFVYQPLVDERQARRRALKQFLGRFFGGSPAELVLNVVEDEQIDPAELRRLKQLLEGR